MPLLKICNEKWMEGMTGQKDIWSSVTHNAPVAYGMNNYSLYAAAYISQKDLLRLQYWIFFSLNRKCSRVTVRGDTNTGQFY